VGGQWSGKNLGLHLKLTWLLTMGCVSLCMVLPTTRRLRKPQGRLNSYLYTVRPLGHGLGRGSACGEPGPSAQANSICNECCRSLFEHNQVSFTLHLALRVARPILKVAVASNTMFVIYNPLLSPFAPSSPPAAGAAPASTQMLLHASGPAGLEPAQAACQPAAWLLLGTFSYW